MTDSLAQNLLAASPYLVVHAVHQVQQYATPAPPNPPNILHQAQCDPGANISATNDISVLSNRVKLDNPFPVASADRTSPAMLASVLGTYILRLSDGTTCDIPMYFCPSLSDTIISPQHLTTMDASHQLFRLISQDVVGFSFRVPTHVMPHSSTCINATTCTLLLVPLPSLLDPSFLVSPRSRSCFLNCGINALATLAPRNSVLLSSTRQVSRPISQLGFTRCTRARPEMMERFSVLLWVLHRTRHRLSRLPAFI
jgi:hypothetical protein